MALNQFGAVMTFAIDMEQQLAEFYENAARKGGAYGSEMQNRAETCKKLAALLEQSRRQNVTEITLEPIEGLNEAEYAMDLSDPSTANVNSVEAAAQRFYADAAPKINVREAQQVLQRCLKQHNRMEALS